MSEQERDNTAEQDLEGQQSIVDFGSSLIQSKRGTIHVLTIVGQIEGHQVLPPTSKSTKYEHVVPLLALVEESDEIDGLLVLLNTVGVNILILQIRNSLLLTRSCVNVIGMVDIFRKRSCLCSLLLPVPKPDSC